MVGQLPRHMHKVHGWPDDKAKNVGQIHNLRKRKVPKQKRKMKICPVDGCHSVVLKLRQHMKTHGDKQYTSLSKEQIADGISKYENLSETQNTTEISTERPAHDIPSTSANIAACSNDLGTSFSQLNSFKKSTCTSNVNFHSVLDLESPHSKDVCRVSEEEDFLKGSTDLSTGLEDLLRKFFQWQKGPRGQNLEAVTANYNVMRIKKIMELLNANTLSEFLKPQAISDILQDACETNQLRAATIKTYICSLSTFLKFIIQDEDSFSTPHERNSAQRMKMELPSWSKSYNRKLARQSAVKREEQYEGRVTPENVNTVFSSVFYREVIKKLAEVKDDTDLLNQEFCDIRDTLYFSLFLENAHRAGIISELLTTDFDKRFYEDEVFVVKVMKHKTLGTADAQRLIMHPSLENLMNTYFKYVRPKFSNELSENYFFISSNGAPLSSSSRVSASLRSIAKKVGLGPISANILRKSAVGLTYDSDPRMAEAVSRHMNHSQRV